MENVILNALNSLVKNVKPRVVLITERYLVTVTFFTILKRNPKYWTVNCYICMNVLCILERPFVICCKLSFQYCSSWIRFYSGFILI